jgi:hypothetical protein
VGEGVSVTARGEYSDYIVYVDESDDHSMVSVDPQYPLFVLAACVFSKEDYSRQITPTVQEFKFRFFGHDMVVLHEADIRKARSDFRILLNAGVRASFMDDLTGIVESSPFTIVSSVIRKESLGQRYAFPDNPYHLALTFCLERVFRLLSALGQADRVTHVVFECRGKKEDAELELEFRRICDGSNYENQKLPLQIVMADKKVNSIGLQLADMVARPIGLHVLRPAQENRAYDVLEPKLYRSPLGSAAGYGLKCFP